jgi:putative membrane protein
LTRAGDTLRMEYGSFTRVTATVPVHRIQTIAIHETVLHRMLSRAAVRVTTAGGGTGASGATEREWLAPIIHRAALPALLDELHPGLELGTIVWRTPHPRAFGRIARRSVAFALIIAGGAAIVVGQWAITIGALLIIRGLLRARSHVRHLGWSALPDGVIFRGGWFRRTTSFARFSRVQAVQLEESPLDRRASMAHVSVDTAAAPLGITYLAKRDAVELKELVARHAAGTAFTW